MNIRVFKEPWQAAVAIAEVMVRSGKPRIRLSHKALSKFAGRIKLADRIICSIENELREYGYLLIRLQPSNSAGGYVIMSTKTLPATRPVDINLLFSKKERRAIINGTFDFDALHRKLMEDDEDEEDEDDEI